MTSGSWAELRLSIVGGALEAASEAHERTGAAELSASTLLSLDAGQSVQVVVTTNSSGSPGLGTTPGFLSMHWVGPR